ncbi:MAG TPA: HAMP domain-containing sensor histidine kinase, partial [Gemmatimonadaceae bacterium]|nr:HAMP domain-containing sensor histidine kinase [Gemmatimonadaceae bacterium]
SAAVETLRRARISAERHSSELAAINHRLEQEMEEVQVLTEELQEANGELGAALTKAEHTAARASALQEVTAALSTASTAPDVVGVVLTRGMTAVHATRGCIAVAEDDEGMQVIGDCGFPDSSEVRSWYGRRDVALPIAVAMKERRPVWLRSPEEYRTRFSSVESTAALGGVPAAHLALPLLHGEDLVGGVAFDFAEAPDTGATDELFTSVLARATADALFRARQFDAEREARQHAEVMSRAREEVLSIVAHDLRNPLNLVGSSAQLLIEPNLSSKDREAAFAINGRAVRRMNRLIGDLLDVARLEAGRLSLDARPCRLDRILAEAVEALRSRANDQRIELTALPGPPDIVIQADAERLAQVLDNLIGNALKFTPNGGRITLSSESRDGDARVAVADTGPGIPEEHRARLFDRFWQATGTDRRGIGLGLAIARGIVEAHGGKLWVESTVGRGTTFYFTVPTANA